MEQVLISVIIPVYNVESYVARCVKSVVGQSYKKLEIILIDDGSTDKSGIICDDLAKSDNRIVVIHKENGGLSSARNKGLDVCHGDFISFIDSDDYIEENMFEDLLLANEKNKTLIACGGRFDCYENEEEEKTIGLCPLKNEVIDSKEAIKRLLTWDNIDSASCDKLFHKSLWKTIRFPLGKICEDIAVMYLIFDCAKRICLVSEPYYNYFHRKGSITTSSFSFKKMDIVDNVGSIEAFIGCHYPDLFDDFLFFKAVECHYLIICLLKTTLPHKDVVCVEKSIIKKIRQCKRIFKRFKGKARISYHVFSTYFSYMIFRFFYRIFKYKRIV